MKNVLGNDLIFPGILWRRCWLYTRIKMLSYRSFLVSITNAHTGGIPLRRSPVRLHVQGRSLQLLHWIWTGVHRIWILLQFQFQTRCLGLAVVLIIIQSIHRCDHNHFYSVLIGLLFFFFYSTIRRKSENYSKSDIEYVYETDNKLTITFNMDNITKNPLKVRSMYYKPVA